MRENAQELPIDRRTDGQSPYRLLLRCLVAEGGETDIVQLSVACARELYEGPVTAIPPEKRRRLYEHCRETVIRQLSARDVVEYCPTDGTVRLEPALDRSV